jgi:hypothetical protein
LVPFGALKTGKKAPEGEATGRTGRRDGVKGKPVNSGVYEGKANFDRKFLVVPATGLEQLRDLS